MEEEGSIIALAARPLIDESLVFRMQGQALCKCLLHLEEGRMVQITLLLAPFGYIPHRH